MNCNCECENITNHCIIDETANCSNPAFDLNNKCCNNSCCNNNCCETKSSKSGCSWIILIIIVIILILCFCNK